MATSSTIVNASLFAAVDKAAQFLAQPLTRNYPATTVIDFQAQLIPALIQHCAPTWNLAQPLSKAGSRCLSFAPGAAPPRVVFYAAQAARLNVEVWVSLLTRGSEFDLFIDPGRVAVSDHATGRARTIWTQEQEQATTATGVPLVRPTPIRAPSSKTLAQMVDADDDAEELFALISDEQVHTPLSQPGAHSAWLGAALDAFPIPPARSDSRASAASSTHSRSSSFSSLSSSSGASFSSVGSDDSGSTASSSQSRRDRARAAKVFVDASKKEVTPYDGGKTTVLTGGVMLGAKPTTPRASTFAAASPAVAAPRRSPPAATANTWRRF